MINLRILSGMTRTHVVLLVLPKGKNEERSESNANYGNYSSKTEIR